MKAFLREVAESLVTTLGNDLQHTAIIFNNKRPVPYLQHHLADVIGKPFWSPSFFTIQEFFALSSNFQVADGFTQFFTLFEAYNELLTKEGDANIKPDVFYPVARIILSDFAQIDNDLVDANRLFEELGDIAVIQKEFQHLTEEQREFLERFWSSFSVGKQQNHQEQFIRMWRRMPKLYESFHQRLKEKGKTTMAHIYRTLAEGKEDIPEFINAYGKGKLAFAGFNALSNAEAVLFQRWSEAGKALFYFDTDAYYMEDQLQEAGLFLRKNIHKLQLPNALAPDKSMIRNKDKEVRVYKALGQTAQAKVLQEDLLADYPDLDVQDSAGKLAVILADESLLLPVLQTIPSQYDHGSQRSAIDINVTMGYPLLASSLFGLADLWLTIQVQLMDEKKDTVYYREVEAFLSHPLVAMESDLRTRIQSKILTEQQIDVPVLRLQYDELSALFFTKASSNLSAINNLQAIFKLILQGQLEDKTLRQTEADLFLALIRELNRLHDTLADYAPQLPLRFVLSLMQKAVQGISVPLSGEPLQGVQVMGLLESRSLDFENVYILGVNEGLLPQVNVSPSFIPDSIRRAYGLPVIENQDAISAYMFYRLLQRSKKITLVYNGQADDSNTGEPSRFLRQLEFESGYSIKYIDQEQSISTERKRDFNVVKDAEVLKKLHAYLDVQNPYSPKLSASALTTYMNCQVQFFFKYIAKIQEPEEMAENLEANNIGSMLHLVLERFYEKLKNEDPQITKDRIAAERKSLPELCRSAFSKVMFDKDEAAPEYNGMQQVVLAIVLEYANVILDYDEKEAPFTLVELENKEDYVISFPVTVDGREQAVNLYGIIDRVDKKNGVTRIVDYKTGRDELRYSSLPELFSEDGNKQNKALVQTLFYTYVYEKSKGIKGVEPNLYLIRKMRDEGTLFHFSENRKKVILQAEHLESMKENFGLLLRDKLEELFDPETEFRHTKVPENCAYCPYSTICNL